MLFINQDLTFFTDICLRSTRLVVEAFVAYSKEKKGWGLGKLNICLKIICYVGIIAASKG